MPESPNSFPDVLRIESVGKCNFKCVHCPTGIQPNNRANLSNDKFNLIIDQCAVGGYIPRTVVLYHSGEPLINKNLAQYIRVLKKMGVRKTVITTNASLLNKERSEELIMAGLDEMKISFDGENADENNIIRRNGDFYRDAANVRALLKLRKQLGHDNPRIIINNTRICDKNTLIMLERKNVKDQLAFQDIPMYLSQYFMDSCDEIDFRSAPAMIWPDYDQYKKFEEVKFPIKNPKYCSTLFETFTILSNGNVALCCYDLKGELMLGNVFETNIFDIWISRKYTELRTNFKKQIYCSLCSRCNIIAPRYLCKKSKPAKTISKMPKAE